MSENKKKVQKARNFAFLLYLDSANPNWKKLLSEMCIQGFSIYHDRDLTEEGKIKKPHYHVLLRFDNTVSEGRVNELAALLGVANGQVQRVTSYKGYARYLCHLDSQDKARYEIESVESYGGADYVQVIGTDEDKINTVAEIINFCDNSNLYSYSRLVKYCLENRRDWFRVLCIAGYGKIIHDYIKSSYWTSINKL